MIIKKKNNGIKFKADDFGLSSSIDEAIIELSEKKIVKYVSCIVNLDSSFKNMNKLLMIEGLSIGLHLNLGNALPVKRASFLNIAKEIESQINIFKKNVGYYPKYIDSHQYIFCYPVLGDILISTLKKLKLEIKIMLAFGTRKLGIKTFLISSGSLYLKMKLRKLGLLHNMILVGIYNFKSSKPYDYYFNRIVESIEEDLLLFVMHPSRETVFGDQMGTRRVEEYLFLKKYHHESTPELKSGAVL